MGVMHAYTGQLLPVAGAAAGADDLTVAVDLSVFRLLSSEAASHAAVNTGHSRSYEQNIFKYCRSCIFLAFKSKQFLMYLAFLVQGWVRKCPPGCIGKLKQKW